ncbi:CapA family protein [Clostridium sp. 'deep sea']|uniref:CapA family protein n=1 Tax=Clostridium sp. 'deep sea' TaxID=2779445 RepID=UPI0018966BDC|nr:CapA family protein [Clostridium sp. 'deep sea']QOR36855.1 CapA family protein [Clostridium sp. 'deep sea']
MKKLLIFIIFTIVMSMTVFCALKTTENEIHLVAVGDILLSRDVEKKMIKEGLNYPYKQVEKCFIKKDIVLGNLENPIYEGNNPVCKNSNLIFKAKNANATKLKEAGFTILNLANNHTMDYKEAGLANTMQALHNNGISYIGAGVKNNEARKPLVIEKEGYKIGFLGYSMFSPRGYIYNKDKADICRVKDNIAIEIKKAKAQCDFLVVTVHWGNEFDFFPSEKQKKLAHEIIDSGADLILGHHPHVLQGIEQYKDKYIFYSLGNFVFDKQIQKGTDESIILDLTIKNKDIKKIKLIPIKIIDCQPTLATGDVGGYILQRLQKYSSEMSIEIKIKQCLGEIIP